jgi:hypothetical protein
MPVEVMRGQWEKVSLERWMEDDMLGSEVRFGEWEMTV